MASLGSIGLLYQHQQSEAQTDQLGSRGLVIFFFISSIASASLAASTFDVVDGGAIGDGKTDDRNAFLNTWTNACADPGSPTLLIPSGKTFLLSTLRFSGPCSSPIHVQIDGNLTAPDVWSESDKEASHWISFSHVNGLAIDGQGLINGNGNPWWKLKAQHVCSSAPDSFAITQSSDVQLRGLKFIDSPKKHVSIDTTVGVHISGLTITAPATSPNTDGIHIEQSEHVEIMDSVIGTGDDCISIGNGTFNLNISRITCGPGHGISVGSLGRDNSEATVGQIQVSDCNLTNTTNGVRIKTWQGDSSGFARGITFQRINFTAVEKPIIIDQYYCDKKCYSCSTKASELQVSDVHYIDVVGSSVGATAISLNCSKSVGCLGISMENVDIWGVGGLKVAGLCVNANLTMSDGVVPPVRCV